MSGALRRGLAALAQRRVTSWVRRRVLDGLLPPVVRDLRPLNAALNRLWLGDAPLDFQREAWGYGDDDWRRVWASIARAPTSTARDSDASEAQMAWAAARVAERSPRAVLEVGAGRGVLAARVAARLSPGARLCLVEPFASPEVQAPPGVVVEVSRAPARALPFGDGAFDVAVCAHTLEHLPDLISTWREITRVARRSIVIVPLQRWAPCTFDLHLHFFPHLAYLPGLLEAKALEAREIDGDGCYVFEHR